MINSTAEDIALLISAATFIALALIEMIFPLKINSGDDQNRIFNNFSLGIGTMLLSGLVPFGIYSASSVAQGYGLGLFQAVPASWPIQLFAALLAQSAAAYWLHRAYHRFPLLWRIHAVHHSDGEIDLSTSLRNHPFGLALAYPVTMSVNLALGVAPAVALAAATFAFVASLWPHGAIRLPTGLARVAEMVFVTPGLHHVHHSVARATHDSNYGDYLIIWDRLFGTFHPAPAVPYPAGLSDEGPAAHRLSGLLLRPFRGVSGARLAANEG